MYASRSLAALEHEKAVILGNHDAWHTMYSRRRTRRGRGDEQLRALGDSQFEAQSLISQLRGAAGQRGPAEVPARVGGGDGDGQQYCARAAPGKWLETSIEVQLHTSTDFAQLLPTPVTGTASA